MILFLLVLLVVVQGGQLWLLWRLWRSTLDRTPEDVVAKLFDTRGIGRSMLHARIAQRVGGQS